MLLKLWGISTLSVVDVWLPLIIKFALIPLATKCPNEPVPHRASMFPSIVSNPEHVFVLSSIFTIGLLADMCKWVEAEGYKLLYWSLKESLPDGPIACVSPIPICPNRAISFLTTPWWTPSTVTSAPAFIV